MNHSPLKNGTRKIYFKLTKYITAKNSYTPHQLCIWFGSLLSADAYVTT